MKAVIFLALASVTFSFAAVANPLDDVISAAKGKIAVSTEDLPREASDLGRLLKPAAKKSEYRVSGDKAWDFNLVAVLKREAKTPSVHVVFYDRADKDALKKFAPVRAIEVNPAAHNTILSVPSIQVTSDQGFAAGKTYIVRVTELDHNHEVVLAETLLKLDADKPAPAKSE